MSGRSLAASNIIERLNTGTFGDGVPQRGTWGDIPPQQEAGVSDAAVGDKPGKEVSKTMKGYDSGAFIGGMGGDMPFPFSLGTFSATEGDSAFKFPAASSNDGKVRRKPSGGTVEKESAEDPVDESGARTDGGSI